MPPCKITPQPANPACPFRAAAGPITLEIKDIVGSIEFLTAEYNGVPILPVPAKTITFTAVPGNHDLDVVYVFSNTTKGKGDLREGCDQHTLLRKINAGNPAVTYTLCT